MLKVVRNTCNINGNEEMVPPYESHRSRGIPQSRSNSNQVNVPRIKIDPLANLNNNNSTLRVPLNVGAAVRRPSDSNGIGESGFPAGVLPADTNEVVAPHIHHNKAGLQIVLSCDDEMSSCPSQLESPGQTNRRWYRPMRYYNQQVIGFSDSMKMTKRNTPCIRRIFLEENQVDGGV